MTPPVDLLAHARWIEGFARALVREDADDVAQDSWLAALEHPPAQPARPWFATVMRNLARMRFRSTSRRQAREAAHVEPSSVPTPAEIAQRMELQRRLAGAVLALAEPQRTTVVLVFYEGMSPAEVARQLGIPATTVRSRVRAALVTLRERLDAEENGDRKRWQLAFAPLLGPRAPAPATVPVLAIAGALVASAVAILIVATRDTAAPPATPAAPAAPASPEAPATASPPTPPEVVREAANSTPVPPPDPPAPEGPSLLAFVRNVIDGGDQVSAGITPAFRRAEKTLLAHIDECYQLAHRAGRSIAGTVKLDVTITTRPEVRAEIEIDRGASTIRDAETLDCLQENPIAVEEHVERLREQGERIEGPIVMHLTRSMPPPEPATEDWPADTDHPACPAGTQLAGTHRKQQWCATPDGTEHGPAWTWDGKGRLVLIGGNEHGKPENSFRLRDPESD